MGRSLSIMLAVLAPAQDQDCAIVLERARAPAGYVRLVDAYREGTRLSSVTDSRELSAFVRRLEKLSIDPRFYECIQAAALLHTDMAMEATRRLEWEASSVHFDLARRLSSLVEHRFLRDFLLAAALFYQDVIFTLDPEIGFRESASFFDEAVEEFRRDPEILLAAGALWEWSGSVPPGNSGHLKRAQALYERSLRADPGVAEAKLRYANVLGKRGKFGEAEKVLRGIFTLRAEPHIIYRAHMRLGSLAEREDRLTEAVQHYREAVALLPNWQVGYVALSHALHASGAREESRNVLDEALRIPYDDRIAVGWWSYEVGLSQRLESLLSEMREDVVR